MVKLINKQNSSLKMDGLKDTTIIGLSVALAGTIYFTGLLKNHSNQLEERLKKYETSVLIASETLPDYEFHPFLKYLSYLKASGLDSAQEKKALDKINFDAERSGSLEQVLRNIVQIIEFSSPESIDLQTVWGQEKNTLVYTFGRGQGLMISDQGHMITAAHVIVDETDRFQDWNSFAVITEDKKVYTVEKILALSEKYDLALIKTSYHPEHFVPPLFLTSQKAKETYTLVGVKMSGELKFAMTKQGLVSLENPSEIAFVDYYSHGVFESTESRLQRYDKTLHLFTDMLILDQHTQPGFSGSVVADTNGRIIGFVSGGQTGEQIGNQAIVAKSFRVKELIDRYLIHLEAAESSKDK